MYKAVPVLDGLIGGHFAVRGPNGKMIGKEFRLDKKCAESLANSLTEAYNLGTMYCQGKEPSLMNIASQRG